MAKKKVQDPNEVTRIETNRFGEEEEVTYRLGMVLKREKVVKKEPVKKPTEKKEIEDVT